MKAIIISDDQQIIEPLDDFLRKRNFDTIIYRWLLKALDNIEEIRPDLVIVSAQEYPRHWKTLGQFIKSGIGGENTKIFLYQRNELTEEEQEKALEIGINGAFYSVEPDELSKLNELLIYEGLLNLDEKMTVEDSPDSSEDIITVDSLISDSFEEEPTLFEETVDIIFTHPYKNMIVTGKALSYKDSVVEFEADYPDYISDLHTDDLLSCVTISIDQAVKDVNGIIVSDEGNLFIKIESYDD